MSILAAFPWSVNSALPAVAPEADDFRPTAGPDFVPTFEEEAEAAELLNGDDEPTDAYWDAQAEESAAMDAICSGLPLALSRPGGGDGPPPRLRHDRGEAEIPSATVTTTRKGPT